MFCLSMFLSFIQCKIFLSDESGSDLNFHEISRLLLLLPHMHILELLPLYHKPLLWQAGLKGKPQTGCSNSKVL